MLCIQVTNYLKTLNGREMRTATQAHGVRGLSWQFSTTGIKVASGDGGPDFANGCLHKLETPRARFISKETLRIDWHPRNEMAERMPMQSPSSTGLCGVPRASLEDLYLSVEYWNPRSRQRREKYL